VHGGDYGERHKRGRRKEEREIEGGREADRRKNEYPSASTRRASIH
jgi:hypothetical protein